MLFVIDGFLTCTDGNPLFCMPCQISSTSVAVLEHVFKSYVLAARRVARLLSVPSTVTLLNSTNALCARTMNDVDPFPGLSIPRELV